MTVLDTKAAAKLALVDHRFDLREARAVIAATKTSLSAAEARVLGALADSFTRTGPGTAERPYVTAGARDLFDAVFRAHALPFGGNQAAAVKELTAFFAGRDLGAPLAKAPPTTHLVPVVLRDDRPVDGFRETAYVNPTTKKLYLYVDGGGRGNPTPRWYGPFHRAAPAPVPAPAPAPAPSVISPMPPGMSADRRNQVRRTANEVLNATAAGAPGAASFALAELPPGQQLFDTGLRITRGSGSFMRTVSVLLVNDGRPLDALDRYFLRAEGGGQPTRFAGPQPLPALVDPYADGKLTFPDRARSLFYKYSHEERFSWGPKAPPFTVKLARGTTLAGDTSPYFVIPKKADGTLDDPDRATAVYFRHAPSGQWTGPHPL